MEWGTLAGAGDELVGPNLQDAAVSMFSQGSEEGLSLAGGVMQITLVQFPAGLNFGWEAGGSGPKTPFLLGGSATQIPRWGLPPTLSFTMEKLCVELLRPFLFRLIVFRHYYKCF